MQALLEEPLCALSIECSINSYMYVPVCQNILHYIWVINLHNFMIGYIYQGNGAKYCTNVFTFTIQLQDTSKSILKYESVWDNLGRSDTNSNNIPYAHRALFIFFLGGGGIKSYLDILMDSFTTFF